MCILLVLITQLYIDARSTECQKHRLRNYVSQYLLVTLQFENRIPQVFGKKW
jgi:hypothetical protein